MQTIDIAQAIKENSTSVSQNLDSSVLEGLIGGFKFQNTTNYDTDSLDLKNGIYGVNETIVGILNPPPISYGCLISFIGRNISGNLATNNGIQICISTRKEIKARILWGSWNEWIDIL